MSVKYTTYYKYNEETGKYDIPTIGFTKPGFSTSTGYHEITQEEFDRLSAMTYGERSAEIEKGLSDSIKYGYGYYGHDLWKNPEDGKCFLGITSGNSCD